MVKIVIILMLLAGTQLACKNICYFLQFTKQIFGSVIIILLSHFCGTLIKMCQLKDFDKIIGVVEYGPRTG